MSAPSSKISPSDAVSKPDKIRRRVVLPHPEGPRMVTNSPFLICKLTSSSTCLSPNHLDTCLISMMLPPGSTLFSANAVLYYKVIQHKNVKLSQIWGEDTTKLQLYKINGSFFFIAFSDLKVPPRRKDYGRAVLHVVSRPPRGYISTKPSNARPMPRTTRINTSPYIAPIRTCSSRCRASLPRR